MCDGSFSLPSIISRHAGAHSRRPIGTGYARWRFAVKPRAGRRDRIVVVAFALAACLGAHALMPNMVIARDLDGRYANSPLRSWFDGLRSGKGPCCSDADGRALSDVDWEARDSHYRVRIEGQWWDVPDEAVIKEPNRAGRTMVWPVYYRDLDNLLRVEVRCFMPGSMT